jgi:hypothetical protein
MSTDEKAEGGYVENSDYVPVAGLTSLHPDECVLSKRDDTFACIREHDHGGKR